MLNKIKIKQENKEKHKIRRERKTISFKKRRRKKQERRGELISVKSIVKMQGSND